MAGTLALAGAALAAETGISGQGRFRPPAEATSLPPESPFSAQDLASGQVSFRIRWDDAATDRDASPWRGQYPGAIRQFTLRIGQTEVDLPLEQASFEVNDGADAPFREFVRIQVRHALGAHTLTVGWVTINERSKTDDLRGAAGQLHADRLPGGEQLLAIQPDGRFDRSLFVTLSSPTEARRFPIYLQTAAIETRPLAVGARAAQ